MESEQRDFAACTTWQWPKEGGMCVAVTVKNEHLSVHSMLHISRLGLIETLGADKASKIDLKHHLGQCPLLISFET